MASTPTLSERDTTPGHGTAVSSRNMNNVFGPPSELIDIAAFTNAAVTVAERPFQPRFPEDDEDAAKGFDVADIRESLSQTWDNPLLSAHISKDHDNVITSVHGMSKAGKLRRKIRLPEPHTLSPEVAALQSTLDNIKLSCWKLGVSAAPFIRTPKLSDHNALTQPRPLTSGPIVDTPQAEIMISIYNRVPWSPGSVSRSSQHAFLSCQSLGNVFDCLKCPYVALPVYTTSTSNTQSRGCFICLEERVYGDGGSEDDYASKLLTHLEKVTKPKAPTAIQRAPTTIRETTFSSLSLRVNQPYWLVHQGNCEHFVVVDQISLYRDTVPSHAYPLAFHVTPQLVDLCRACSKVPAVWSVVGDVRLGESPCPMCGPCWRNMGEPTEDGVTVLRLPDL